MNCIFVEGLKLEASVGIYPRERSAPQAIEINLRCGLKENVGAHDNIRDTIDYDKVVRTLREMLAARHFNLLESLAEHAADMLIHEFGAPWVKISVAKLGVLRGVAKVGVSIERVAKGSTGTPPPISES